MSTQYLRKYRLLIRGKKGDVLDFSELRIWFSVEKSLAGEAGISRIRIYNPSLSTAGRIKKGDTAYLEAGYASGDYGLIFSGEVLFANRRREDGTTTVLELLLRDGDSFLNTSFTSTSISRGASMLEVADAAIKGGSATKGVVSSALSGKSAPRGRTLFGKSADILSRIGGDADALFYVENGAVNLIEAKGYSGKVAVELSPETGLIGMPEQEEGGVSGTCLINPRIKLKTKLHIRRAYIRAMEPTEEAAYKLPAAEGEYSVVKLKCEGDTHGSPWYMHFDAVVQ